MFHCEFPSEPLKRLEGRLSESFRYDAICQELTLECRAIQELSPWVPEIPSFRKFRLPDLCRTACNHRMA